MTERGIMTNSSRLSRAITLGKELSNIARDPAMHALSREAWDRQCRELAGMLKPADFAALVERCRQWPALWSEITIRATLWSDGRVDRPAPWSGFGPHGDQPSYAERIACMISLEQASAVAAWRCAEMRYPASFGSLSDWSDLKALEQPRLDELATLDAELAATIHLRDVEWDGSAPVIRHAGLTLLIGPGTVGRIALGFAELAQRQLVTVAKAA